jgi:integrase
MASIPRKLSDELIASLPFESGKARIIHDAALPGHRIRVGRRTKVFQFQCERSRRDGAARKTFVLKLGRAPTMKLAAARARAVALMGAVERGEDPRVPEKKPAGRLTLAQAWSSFEQHLIKKPASSTTLTAYHNAFANLKPIHDVPLATLSDDPSIALREHARLSVRRLIGNTRAWRGGPAVANLAIRFLSATFSHARRRMVRGLPEDAPTSAVAMNAERAETRAMGSADLPAWFAAREAVQNPIQRELLLFTLLSGLRSADVRSMRWSELDVRRRVFFRPSPKGGSKKRFDLVLSRPMLQCLARARRAGRMLHPGSPFVWPSTSRSGHVSNMTNKIASGQMLRRSYSTIATEAGVPEEIIGRLLNHRGATLAGQKYIKSPPLLKFLLKTQEAISSQICMHRLSAIQPSQSAPPSSI